MSTDAAPSPAEGTGPGSGFPPIDSYAFLSDTHTAALLGPDGAVDWFCVPQFDGDAVFARLLDRRVGGAFHLEVAGDTTPGRRYLPETLVLESVYTPSEGSATVHDFLAVQRGEQDVPIRADRLLVRRLRVDRGTVWVTARVAPRPDHGRLGVTWRSVDGGWQASGVPLRLVSDLPFEAEDGVLRVEAELTAGQAVAVGLSYADPTTPADIQVDATVAAELFDRTCHTWREWCGRSDYRGVGRDAVLRSALILRGRAFNRSGALLAAPTTSLPEEIGGVRNWDYRYTWHRDAALLLLALFRLGHGDEGRRYLEFLLDTSSGPAERLTPMVGIRGTRIDERVLEHLDGYAGSRPVRIGNEAFDQVQLDTYGHVLDAALAYQELTGDLRPDQWAELRRHVDTVAGRWREPDHGIWEIRGPCRDYVNSKVMSWVCLDRGIRLAELLDDGDAPVDHWRQSRDEVHADVLDRGFDAGLGSFVQAYESTALDASLLRIPLVGFLPGDDVRVVATVERIRQRLGVGPALVKRYDTDEVNDGLSGGEGAFLLCSFELVSALALSGRRDEAERVFHWLCRHAGPLGLFAEQMAADGTALGNYPQAFTHLALIEAALNLDAAEDREALHAWAERASSRDAAGWHREQQVEG